MLGRILVLIASIAGVIGLSQFPEFSQQYLQRLAGQLDALSVVVADFDKTAKRSGLTRDEALAQLQGTEFLDGRRADLSNTFARHERLSSDLAILRSASILERLVMPHRMGDFATLRATWADFKPAVPVTVDGFFTGAIGFVLGNVLGRLLLALLAWPFRRRQAV
jgi:Protein of unknown function (DUF2937)